MGAIALALFFLLTAGTMVARDARGKGIPVLEYVGSLLVVIAIAVGGSALTAWTLGKAGTNVAAETAAFGILPVTLALCIWACYRLFSRLGRKNRPPSS